MSQLTIADAQTWRDQWRELAERHLEMAYILLDDGFHDGAIFHAYHAYECMLCSIIAAARHRVPPDGKTFDEQGAKYTDASGNLFKMNNEHDARRRIGESYLLAGTPSSKYYPSLKTREHYRNDSLYYQRGQMPFERFMHDDAETYLADVRAFLDEIWGAISGTP